MLEVNNITIDFASRRGDVRAARNVSLTLERGEILGLVGESGAGKSTIGNAVMGLLESGGAVTKGSIIFEGENLLDMNAEQMRAVRGRRISMIMQDPMTALNPVKTIADQITETISHNLGLNAKDAMSDAISWLKKMDIPNPEERIHHYPHEFSGGQRQRIVIAMALCGKPDLVIADEPTTALDVSVQAQILQLIKKLVAETNIGIILVTHNMGVVAEVTDRVAIMRHGELVEIGPTSKILSAPETDYAKMLIASVPPGDTKLHRLPVPTEDGTLPPAQAAKHRDFDESDIILKVKDLSITYNPGGSLFSKSEPVRALQNLSFDLPRGASMGLVGESGSGKSTCARGIIGLTPISGGQVYFNDHQISAMSEKQRRPLRPAMQMIFQDPYSSLNKRMSILDVIAEPIRFYGLASNRTEIEQRVVSLLERVGLNGDALKRYPHQFSGGQRQRIAVARTLASKPELIICDEPTSALDVSVQAAVLNLIKDLQDEYNLSLLFISHDLPVVRQMCDDIIVLKQGKLVEMDHTDRIFDNPQADYTKELIDLMPHMDDFKQAQ